MYSKMFKLHAQLLRAMSHPKRLEIIHLLRGKHLCVGEIQDMLDLPQANLSQHLMTLREAGVVSTERKGKNIFYKLSDKNFIDASDALREVLAKRYKDTKLALELEKDMDELVPLTHDLVCGQRLCPKSVNVTLEHKGRTYYFCSQSCKEKFKKNPTKYL